MDAPTSKQNASVLNSWKEIAAYLGRGVRTVQRYERDLALPVRRPRGKSRSAVIALTGDLDAWLHHSPTRTGDVHLKSVHVVVAATSELRTEGGTLRARSSQLREEHHAAVSALVSRLRIIAESFESRK